MTAAKLGGLHRERAERAEQAAAPPAERGEHRTGAATWYERARDGRQAAADLGVRLMASPAEDLDAVLARCRERAGS
ncbi:MAG: hypothetical protein ACYTJ0_20425 [Planctomycetota bacterium]|jgi:hypothetical protein